MKQYLSGFTRDLFFLRFLGKKKKEAARPKNTFASSSSSEFKIYQLFVIFIAMDVLI